MVSVRNTKKVGRKTPYTVILRACALVLLFSTLFFSRHLNFLQDPKLKSNRPISEKPRYDAIFLVMGEQNMFPTWYSRLADIDGITIDLVFGSWDKEIGVDCVGKIRCDSMSLANTTWTSGRNALALRAAEMEVARGKKYDYWMFADDDVDFTCETNYEHIVGKGSCWQKLFNFVMSDYVTGSDKISSVGVPQGYKILKGRDASNINNSEGDMVGATSFNDAMLAIIKRIAVPYLIPYVYLRPGKSAWLSQTAVFCIMKRCMPQSLLFPPPASMTGLNGLARDYIRGGSTEDVLQVTADNFNLTKHNFSLCDKPEDPIVRRPLTMQFKDVIYGDSPEALWDLIPESDWGKCNALKMEFWDKMVAHLDYRGVK